MLSYLVFFAIFRSYYWYYPMFSVHGESMLPTFHESEVVQVWQHRSPKRFDVVVFQPKEKNEPMYLKRVIGLPGETVSYRNGVLYINEREVADPFGELTEDFDWSMIRSTPIPEGCYFVLGDNRMISKDSRTFGVISQQQIKGIIKEETRKHEDNPREN